MPDNPQTGLTQGDVQDLGGFSGGQDPLDAVKQSLVQRYQSLQPKPADGGPIRSLLQNFFSGAGNAMMRHVGLPTAQEQQEKVLSDLGAVTNAQGMQDYHKAVASQYEMMDVPAPDGSTMQLPRKSMAQWMAANARVQAGYSTLDASTAKALGHPELEGSTMPKALLDAITKRDVSQIGADSRETVANQNNQTKASQFRDTMAYKQWKEKLDVDTKLRVAQMNMGKAPAAMMQTATFAKSGLDLLDDARVAFNDLKNRGVLGGVSQDKMENMIFGKGLVDPSLSPADRQKISKLRAALSYTSSAAMRAHTGRTSQEIYNDFKGTMSLGQGSDALEGAMDETQKMLSTYATSASDAAIQNLRNAAGVTPKSSTKSVVKWGRDAQGNPVRLP